MYVLGISALFHDSAAALIKNGEVILAAQEERFTRVKNDSGFPKNAIEFLLKEEGLNLSEINHIVFYDKPWRKFERIIDSIMSYSPKSLTQFLTAMPSWLGEKLYFRKLLLKHFQEIDPNYPANKKVLFSEHHFSHAASCFYTSPFQSSACLVVDGVGEWATLSIYEFDKNGHKLIKQMDYPNSIGILYSAFTYYCGFKINSGEYKLMGLAPYGDKQAAEKIQILIEKNLYRQFDDGSIELNLEHFKFHYGRETINKQSWEEVFGYDARSSDTRLEQFYCDFALAAQSVTEKILLKVCQHVKEITGSSNLCYSGGVALNCVANSKIRNSKLFDKIWIHPSPGDAGGAIGCALGYYYCKQKYDPISEFSPYLGPAFDNGEIERELKKYKITYRKLEEPKLIDLCANLLSQNLIMGWFQGRMEWGPRALGNRSILASPLDKNMQKTMNLKIKFRESFRPFAPVIPIEKAKKFFSPGSSNSFMQYTDKVKGFEFSEMANQDIGTKIRNIKSSLPAITHVDGSARVQTVTRHANPRFHNLLLEFEKITNTPVLINTSFNVRGEPIVCTPEDAIKCFLKTKMDCLVLGNFLVLKNDN